MQRIGLEITHRCNKNCKWCSHRISTSNYDYMTLAQYEHIKTCIQPEQVHSFAILGGEPTYHPHYVELMTRLLEDFGKFVYVWTNAKLIPQFPELLNRVYYVAARYPGWNDVTYREYENHPNIIWKEYEPFRNPFTDPNLTEEQARAVYNQCAHHQTRILGTRLYGCCMAEPVERSYDIGPVHTAFMKTWERDILRLPTWRACQHCMLAKEEK